MLEAHPGLNGMIVNGRVVYFGQGLHKLLEGVRLKSHRHPHDCGRNEFERLAIDNTGNDRDARQVIVDHGDDRVPQIRQRVETQGIYDCQALAQDPIADLDSGPGGKVVGIDPCPILVPKQGTVSVVVDRIKWNLPQQIRQLLFGLCLQSQHLPQLDAAAKRKGHFGAQSCFWPGHSWVSRLPYCRLPARFWWPLLRWCW